MQESGLGKLDVESVVRGGVCGMSGLSIRDVGRREVEKGEKWKEERCRKRREVERGEMWRVWRREG